MAKTKKTSRSKPRKAAKKTSRKTAKRTRRPRKLGALPWRIAYSLDKTDGLFAQVNARAPGRATGSDGSIGDAAHQSRSSDHNAWRRGARGEPVVGAIDVTHDPRGGFDSYAFAESLRKYRDPRVKYVISNGKIWNPSVSPEWRTYVGKNPHDHHVHVSVSDSRALFDRKGQWMFDTQHPDSQNGQVPGDRPVQPVPTDPVLRRGSKYPKDQTTSPVHELQRVLGVVVDGDFGPATERAVKAFQVGRGLAADGVVGPATWRALRAAKVVSGSGPLKVAPTSREQVREFVFSDEGRELTVHSHEPGGASRLGISIDTLSRHIGRQATQQDLLDMSEDMAWEIYDKDFWDRIEADKLPAGLNYAAFDFAVNSGPAVVDGDETNNPRIVRDFLAQALEEKDVRAQIDKLCDLRLEYMKTNPEKWERYRRGWTARVDRVRSRAHAMAS